MAASDQPGSGSSDHTIVFTPSGRQGTVADGTSVLEAARNLGVDLDTVCGGRGICGRCQVQPGVGAFPKWAMTVEASALSEPGDLENSYRGNRPLAADHRLGCGALICGDVVVDIPPESQIHKQIVRKEVSVEGLALDPLATLHYLELDERPDDGATGESQDDGTAIDVRILEQVAKDWDFDAAWLATAAIEARLLSQLHAAGNKLTVAVRGTRVIAVWPGFVEQALGIAVDIGSTTIAGHLCDLASGAILATAGQMNPQIRFGEDLMSRVSYVMMNDGGKEQLTAAVRSALGDLTQSLLGQDHRAETVLDVVLVGNPIMHHLALNIDPTPLGQSPFPLATAAAVNASAKDLGLDLTNAALYFAPCIAGHVGADTAAAILAEKPYDRDGVTLLVDVGTNAEIVLGDTTRLLAASSPTGPAFEGAQISGGQRATAGAIERIRIDRETLEPRLRVIGSELWSDEEGFADAIAKTGITGICGSGIIEVIGEMFLAGLIDAQGVVASNETLASAGRATTDRISADGRTFAYRLTDSVTITQGDVRAIQLAKAALRAGIDLLVERGGFEQVDRVRLAGAFGAHIDPLYAMVLGLVPDGPVEAVKAVGNAAGSGAVRALLSAAERTEMEQAVAAVTKIETATEPRFQELFVSALAFPHLDAPTTHLAQRVKLPERTTAAKGRRRRSRIRTGAEGRSPDPGQQKGTDQ